MDLLIHLNLLGTEKVVRTILELHIKAVNAGEYMEQINDLKYNSHDACSVFRSVYKNYYQMQMMYFQMTIIMQLKKILKIVAQ